MPSYLTRTEYIISITTRSSITKDDILQTLRSRPIFTKDTDNVLLTNERKVPICPVCYQDVDVAYTSYGPVYMCSNSDCNWNNMKDYPQCVKCNEKPQEPTSTTNMCYTCDPAFAHEREIMSNLRHHARDD